MGLFDKLFGRDKPKPVTGDYRTLTAYSPVFISGRGQIYESELIRAAINVRATHISKLKVEMTGHGAQFLSKRLERPSELQTWSQFMYRLSTILDVDNTAFVVPEFDRMGRVISIYPVLPSRCKLVEVQGSKDPWLAFEFASGRFAQLPVWKVGVMTRFQYRNDYFGESNRALSPTMNLIDINNQATVEGMKSAATYRFMAQYSNVAFGEDLAKEQQRFTEANFSAKRGGGMLLFPSTYNNIQQIKSSPYVIDADMMKQIRESVYDYYGVNDDVLQGKASGDKWVAFYESSIEPFAIQFSEVMTDLFRLCGELTGDARVYATANRLQYMSNSEKLQVSSQLADRGILNRDEVREIWNLPPLPDGSGQEYIIRGEYWNADEKINGGEEDASQE